jgi:hypothetical protein
LQRQGGLGEARNGHGGYCGRGLEQLLFYTVFANSLAGKVYYKVPKWD